MLNVRETLDAVLGGGAVGADGAATAEPTPDAPYTWSEPECVAQLAARAVVTTNEAVANDANDGGGGGAAVAATAEAGLMLLLLILLGI